MPKLELLHPLLGCLERHMGLLENPKKTQVCARKQYAKQNLHSSACPQDCIRSDIKALGCTTTFRPRKESSTLLRSVPLAWRRKTLAFNALL